jgi:hypothetical protein
MKLACPRFHKHAFALVQKLDIVRTINAVEGEADQQDNQTTITWKCHVCGCTHQTTLRCKLGLKTIYN